VRGRLRGKIKPLHQILTFLLSYPFTFSLQFLSGCSTQCKDMGCSGKELLCLATGAIDRAFPLLQDPVLLSARHLPPALTIYVHLRNFLLRLNKETFSTASGIHGLTIRPVLLLLCFVCQSIHHDDALLLPVLAHLHAALLAALCKRN